MKNAVIYARYSSSGQREESIVGQLRDCHAYAERNGLTVLHEYTDSALTGTSDKRPAFQQMIHDSKKRQFEVVLVWKIDRFARNRYDSAALTEIDEPPPITVMFSYSYAHKKRPVTKTGFLLWYVETCP